MLQILAVLYASRLALGTSILVSLGQFLNAVVESTVGGVDAKTFNVVKLVQSDKAELYNLVKVSGNVNSVIPVHLYSP